MKNKASLNRILVFIAGLIVGIGIMECIMVLIARNNIPGGEILLLAALPVIGITAYIEGKKRERFKKYKENLEKENVAFTDAWYMGKDYGYRQAINHVREAKPKAMAMIMHGMFRSKKYK